MTCDKCRWKKERNKCPWNYDYADTDYAEDCIDFRNVNFPEDMFNNKILEVANRDENSTNMET